MTSPAASPAVADAPAERPPRMVLPGDTTLRGALVRPGTNSYTLTMIRNGTAQQFATLTDVIRWDTVAKVSVMHRVQTLQRGTTGLVDSTTTNARTLAPRMHRSYQSARKIMLEFSGRRVKGSFTPTDLPGIAVDTTLSTNTFDSGSWDLLVRALPLDSGYAAQFPVYDFDAGLHLYIVRVTGSDTVSGEAAHVVRFTLASTRHATVWIAKESRAILQIETPLGDDYQLRQVLQRPGPRVPAVPPE
ncbi:MAG TPA: hypothetical protein VE869_06395 [Gemmatimonas sp.]|nr:hypothetical protein [Gemmatimonas sp.]